MAQRYRKDEFIGKGAYGSVYKAFDLATNQVVAIKILNLDTREDEVRDIQREIATLSQLNNKYITRYHGSFLHGTRLWITMDYAAGGSIRDMIEAGAIGEPYIVTITHDVLQALVYLHHNDIIHRDIKAANILMTEDGTVQLCDFGVARSISSTSMRRYSFAGTPYWMAPEVISQSSGYDAKVDIWSLGITVYEMATGNPPHAEQDPKRVLYLAVKSAPPKLGANHSPAIRDFVASCLQVQPEDRPTADQLLKAKFVKNHKRHNLKELLGRSRKPWSADLMSDKLSISSVSSESTGFGMEPVTSDGDDNGWDFNQPLVSATTEADDHPRARTSTLSLASHGAGSLPEHMYRSAGDLVSRPPQFVQDLFSADSQMPTSAVGEPRDGLYPGITGYSMNARATHGRSDQPGIPVQPGTRLMDPSGRYYPPSSDRSAGLPAHMGSMPLPQGPANRSSIHVPSGSGAAPRMSLSHAHIPYQGRLSTDASSTAPPLSEQPKVANMTTRHRSGSNRPPPLRVIPGPPSAQQPISGGSGGMSFGEHHHINLPGAGMVGPPPASTATGAASHRRKPSVYYGSDSVRSDDMALLSLPPPINVRSSPSTSDQMGGTGGLEYRASVDGVPLTSPTVPTSNGLPNKSGSHSFIRAPLRRVRSFHSAKKKALANLRLPSALHPHLYHKLKHGSSGGSSNSGGVPLALDHSSKPSDIKVLLLSASSSSKSGSTSVASAPGGGRVDRDGAVVGHDSGLLKPLSVRPGVNSNPLTGVQASPSGRQRGRAGSIGAASAMAPSHAAEVSHQHSQAKNAAAAGIEMNGLSGALRKSTSLHSLSKPDAEPRRPQPTDLVPPSPSRFNPPLFGTSKPYSLLAVPATQVQSKGWRPQTLHTRSHSSTCYDAQSSPASGEQLVPPMGRDLAHDNRRASGWLWSSWHLPSDASNTGAISGNFADGLNDVTGSATAMHRTHSLEARHTGGDGMSPSDHPSSWSVSQRPCSAYDHSTLYMKSGPSAALDPHLHKALASQASSRRSHNNLKMAAYHQASRLAPGRQNAQPSIPQLGRDLDEPLGNLMASTPVRSNGLMPSSTSAPSDVGAGRSLATFDTPASIKVAGTLPAQANFDLMCDPAWVRKKLVLSLLEVQEWINVIQQDFEKLAL